MQPQPTPGAFLFGGWRAAGIHLGATRGHCASEVAVTALQRRASPHVRGEHHRVSEASITACQRRA